MRGGMEAAVHSTRQFIGSLDDNGGLVKLDFRNAFNTLRRDTILEAALETLPETYSYINSSYSSNSKLFFLNHIIESETGVQQGDPLGPLLFCLCLQPILQRCKSDLRIGYLDDVTLGGDLQTLVKDVSRIKVEALSIGLQLNDSKCELIRSSTSSPCPSFFNNFTDVITSNATLLGSPLLQDAAMTSSLEKG